MADMYDVGTVSRLPVNNPTTYTTLYGTADDLASSENRL